MAASAATAAACHCAIHCPPRSSAGRWWRRRGQLELTERPQARTGIAPLYTPAAPESAHDPAEGVAACSAACTNASCHRCCARGLLSRSYGFTTTTAAARPLAPALPPLSLQQPETGYAHVSGEFRAEERRAAARRPVWTPALVIIARAAQCRVTHVVARRRLKSAVQDRGRRMDAASLRHKT